MVKLEVGKYYKTRDGRKVGPMKSYKSFMDMHPFESDKMLWTREGVAYQGSEPDQDIVAEWPDDPPKPQPTLSGETIDRIAIDSLRFHMADKDMEPLQVEAFRIVLRYYGVTV